MKISYSFMYYTIVYSRLGIYSTERIVRTILMSMINILLYGYFY